MKKKIVFVTQALWVGGIETALVNLLNHLNYEKYDVTCVITEDYQQMADLITPKCKLHKSKDFCFIHYCIPTT